MRVGVILGSDEDKKEVKFLGYGEMVGNETPPNYGPDERPNSMIYYIAKCKGKNPKIVLDNGEVIWGCECWWGEEEKFRRIVKVWEEQGWKIVRMTVKEAFKHE